MNESMIILISKCLTTAAEIRKTGKTADYFLLHTDLHTLHKQMIKCMSVL